MFEIEAERVVMCTCKISDKDEERIRDYIKNNPDEFELMFYEEAILKAISILNIDLYKNYTESDGYTNCIR